MTTPDQVDPATLLRNTLIDLHMRQNSLALRTGLSTKHVNQIAQGIVPISSDVALRFERATGVPALEWMRAEAAYRDGLLRRRPRVWWSDRDGVLEELPSRGGALRVLRVVNSLVLDGLPSDAVELVPAASTRSPASTRRPCAGCGSKRVVERARRAYCTEPTCDRRLPGPPCETCQRPRALHVCLSCSPDGLVAGPGCINCRDTGWNQTPCLPPVPVSPERTEPA